MTTQGDRRVTCRYLRQSGEQCTGEAVDPVGDVLLCSKHLARAMTMIRDATRPLGKRRSPEGVPRGR